MNKHSFAYITKQALIKELEFHRGIQKKISKYVNEYWKLSDKDKPETEFYFRMLNIFKNNQRANKKKIRKIETALRSLKRL